jgi:hypothetical protein
VCAGNLDSSILGDVASATTHGTGRERGASLSTTSLFVQLDKPLTIDQIERLPDVIDYGKGAALTNFNGTPDAKSLGHSLERGLSAAIKDITGVEPERAKMEGDLLGDRRGTCRSSSNAIMRLGRKTREFVGGLEAALSKLGLVDRTDPATMAVAKLIIEFAKEGERDPERLCALALKQLSV